MYLEHNSTRIGYRQLGHDTVRDMLQTMKRKTFACKVKNLLTTTNATSKCIVTDFVETWLADTLITVVVRCSTFGTTPDTTIIRCQDVVRCRALLNEKKSSVIFRSFDSFNHKDIITCIDVSQITCITFDPLYIGYSSRISSLVQYENVYQEKYTMTVIHIYNKYHVGYYVGKFHLII